eukprot:6997869-Prymnesium_polylepis.1
MPSHETARTVHSVCVTNLNIHVKLKVVCPYIHTEVADRARGLYYVLSGTALGHIQMVPFRSPVTCRLLSW